MYKLSVVIPVHNTQKYLKKCIDSIFLNNEYKIQIIIIDNNSQETYNELLNKYDNINFIQLEENIGPGGARNIGIHIAESKYIAFCDSDDWVDSNFYDNILSAMEKTNADIGIGGIKRNFEYPSNERIVKCRFDKSYTLNNDMLFRIMSREYDTGLSIPPSSVNKVYNREFLIKNNILFPESKFYEDLLFSAKASLLINKAICVPNVYYHHFKRIGSITQSFQEKHILDYVDIFTEILKFLNNNNLYENYMYSYYKFADHFFNLVIRQLFEYEKDEEKRKQYMKEAISKFHDVIIIDDYIKCKSSEELRRHIQPLLEDTTIN